MSTRSKRKGRRAKGRATNGAGNVPTRWRMDSAAGTSLEERWEESRRRAETQSAGEGGDDPGSVPRVQLDGAATPADGGAAPANGAAAAPAAGGGNGGAAPADGAAAAPAAGGGNNGGAAAPGAGDGAPRLTLAAGTVEAAVQAERERVGGIYALLAREDAPEGATADRWIADGSTVEAVERALWNDRADLHARQDGAAGGRLGRVDQDVSQTAEGRMFRGMSDALIERAGRRAMMSVQTFERDSLGEADRVIDGGEYRGMRAIDLCRVSLEAGGNRGRSLHMDPDAMVQAMFQRAEMASARALADGDLSSWGRVQQARRWAFSGGYELVGQQGRDQFPNALENAMHRILHATYAGERTDRFVWRNMCEIGSASDFRPHIHNFLGGLPDMEEAAESGQYPLVGLDDTEKGSIAVKSRGSEVRISRETIVDDDLGRVMRTMGHLAHSAHRTVENLWFFEVAKRGNLGEFSGADMFTAARGNLSTGVDPISAETIYAGMVALETQKAVGDRDYAELRADTILVHPSQYGLARTIILSPLEVTGANKGAGGPSDLGVRGMIGTILRSPRVSNPKRWFLVDSMATPWMASFLFGRDAPYLQQVEPWSMRGTCYLGAIDVGVAPLTWRGAFCNKGTA